MRFCQPHWDKLRHEIEIERNLAHLVGRSGPEAMEKVMAQHSTGDIDKGDPLLDAHMLILSKSMGLLADNGVDPMYMFSQNEDGSEKCPLCVISSCDDSKCPNNCKTRDTLFISKAGEAMERAYAAKAKKEN